METNNPATDKIYQSLRERFTIKSCRAVRGHDGQGFEAKLARDGKLVAHIFDDGWGGEYQWEWVDKGAEADWNALVARSPRIAGIKEGETMEEDDDGLLSKMLDNFENARRLKRLQRTGTVVEVPNPKYKGGPFDPEDEAFYYHFKGRPIDEKLRALIAAKYPTATAVHPMLTK